MELFPKENFQQSILEQSIISKPDAGDISTKEDIISFNWNRISDDKVSFKIDTTLEVKNNFPQVLKTLRFPISSLSRDLEKYTRETEHIDIISEIRAEANEVVAGETDLFIAVYKIADWVKINIEYDLNTLTAEADQKASWVFTNKKGVCDEITNLFIAMLRSVNIPSRFVSGIVYSNLDNNFGNHGWAEVYFPGYGWIPFDVTYGQYGWIDPTHIKLDDSYDSGVPSVEYHWKSRDVEVKADSLEFKTEVKQKNGRISPYVDMEIKPLKDKISFGSYVPIEVTVKNLKNCYLPQTIFITKAPDLIDKSNSESFVLKPGEDRRLYWLIKTPSDLEEEYIYTSELEVKNIFGTMASNAVKYAKSFEHYSKEWAEETMKLLSEREDKFFFSNLNLNCNSDKDSYYSIEDAGISCSVINTGNVQLSDVNICLAEGCKKISLGIGEKKEASFTKPLTKSETVTISAENQDMIRYAEVKLNVVEIPDLQVVEVQPEAIGYDEEGMLIFSLVTESPAYNVKVNIKNLGIAEWDTFSDKRFLKIPFQGRDFSEGVIKVHMSYDDALNKTYTKDEEFPILVTNIPIHVEAWTWLKNLFKF